MGARHLVTGAAGVIGFALARELLERGDAVVALDSFKKGGKEDLAALARDAGGRLQVIETDLARLPLDAPSSSSANVLGIALRGRFDAIFHFAAIVGVRYVTEHPYETMWVNMRSTLHLLDFARREGCGALFFASSSENYASGADAGTVPVPTPEEVPLGIGDSALPRWSYAASKIAGESALFAAAREGAFTPVVVRFHNVYGPRMGPTHVIPEMLERCTRRVDPFPVFGVDQTRSFLHADDAARALVLVLGAAREGRGGVINVGAPKEISIGELARVVFEVTGHRPKLELHPAPPGSVRRRVPDVSKLNALGFAPRVGLEEGVRECWERWRA